MDNTPKIAIVSLSSGGHSQYWKYIEDGIAAAAKQFSVKYDYYSPMANSSEKAIAEWQLITTEKISRDPDVKAAGVAMFDPVSGARGIEALYKSGKACITFDTDVPFSRRSFFVGANNIASGRICAFKLAKLVKFKGKIVIDSPSYTIQSLVDRVRGFKEAIAKFKQIKIVETGGVDSPQAMRKVAETTAKDLEVSGIFCPNGGSAKMNIDILKTAGRAKSVSLVCINVDSKIRDHIRNGLIDMAIGQRPFSIGYRLADYLYQITRDGLDTTLRSIPPSRIVDTGMHQVSRENLDAYIETLEKMQQMGM